MTDWINNKYGTTLSEADLVEIKDFSLLWNIYENTIFDNNFTIDKLEVEIIRKQLQINQFNDTLDYFKNRYTENGATNNRFNHLNFRPRDREPLVREVLTNININDHDKILAIGIIVFRYRNNLFHGLKDFRTIDQQAENFRNANTYLRTFLDS